MLELKYCNREDSDSNSRNYNNNSLSKWLRQLNSDSESKNDSDNEDYYDNNNLDSTDINKRSDILASYISATEVQSHANNQEILDTGSIIKDKGII